MNLKQAAKFLTSIGHPELFIHKAEGVWYLIGGEDSQYDPSVERCLHVVRQDDISEDVLRYKIEELTR